MNKLERKLKEQKLWMKRIKRLGDGTFDKKIIRVTYIKYKKQTRPCSCSMCKMPRYNRKSKHKEELITL